MFDQVKPLLTATIIFVCNPLSMAIAAELNSDNSVLHTGDFNNDNKVDLLYQAKTDQGSHGILLGDGAGQFNTRLQTWYNGHLGLDWDINNHNLHIADFGQDNRSDVLLQPKKAGLQTHIVSTSDSNYPDQLQAISVSWADGTLGLNWSSTKSNLAIGDFNGDGQKDVLVQGRYRSDTHATVLLNASLGPTGILQQWNEDYLTREWSAQTHQIHVGDFNGDGRSDLFLQAKYQFVLIPMDDLVIPVPTLPKTLHAVLLADANGTFTAVNQSWDNSHLALDEAWLADKSNVIIADTNGDGRDDILLQSKSATGTHYLLQSDATAQFTAVAQSWQDGYLGQTWSGDNTQIIAADFNSDGRSDLLLNTNTGAQNIVSPDVNGLLPTTSTVITDTTKALLEKRHAGSVSGSFDVTDQGAATYSIPIQVPPGIGGMQPELSLVYNSMFGNGMVGVGWSLAGLSAIHRCPQTLVQDNNLHGVDYTTDDRFCMDGQRMVVLNGAVYGANNTEYRTESESYTKIILNDPDGVNGPDSFTVWTKSGQIIEYGVTEDARIQAQGKPAVNIWAVNKISDTVGNVITFSYDEDSANGSYHINRIDYGYNATGASLSVRFRTTDRSDSTTGYVAGSKSSLSRILTNVKTYVGERLVKDYRLDYELSPATKRSRLTGVSECDFNGTCKAPSTIEWSGAVDTFAYPTLVLCNTCSPGGATFNEGFQFQGDFNGDGKMDYLFNYGGWYVALSNGNGFDDPVLWLCQNCSPSGQTFNINPNFQLVGDMNGDGKTDLLFNYGGWHVAFSNGNGFDAPTLWLCTTCSPSGQAYNENYQYLDDFNGDGLPDMMFMDSVGSVDSTIGSLYVALSNGSSFETPTLWLCGECSPSGQTFNIEPRFQFVNDMNGDGRSDYIYNWGGWYVALSNGNGFDTPELWLCNTCGPTGQTHNLDYQYFGDFNGDGLPDLMYNWYGWHVALNDGKKLSTPTLWLNGPGQVFNPDPVYHFTADFNGDGMTDYMYNYAGWHVALSNGTGFDTPVLWLCSTCSPSGQTFNSGYQYVGDFTGDGKADYLFNWYGWHLAKSAAETSDMLTGLTNGLGEKVNINYKPLTDNTVYTKYVDAAYPLIRDMQAAMYVVSSYNKPDGLGGLYSHSYKYEGAKAHTRGRGYLGFAKVTITDDQTGIAKVTEYRQDFPFAGMSASSKTILADGTTVINESVNTWVDLYASEATITDRYSVQLESSTVTSRELNNTIVSTVTTTNTYDLYANALTVVVDSLDGYKKTTTNTYYPADTVNWILGRLETAGVKSDAPLGLSETRYSSFAYDTVTGLLLKEIVEPCSLQAAPCDADLELTTTYTYDGYGNKATSTVSGNLAAVYPIASRTTTNTVDYSLLSDSIDPRIIVTTTNALGHSESKIIDPRWGGTVSLTGPNGLTTNWEYDPLGRKVREDRADSTWSTIAYNRCDTINTTTCAYDSPMSVTKQSAGGMPGTTWFDKLGREIISEAVGFDGRTVYKRTDYNVLGQTLRTSLPSFNSDPLAMDWHGYTYDVLGRVTVETFPNNSTAGITYNGLTTVYTNDKGQTTTKLKNSQGKLISSTDNMLGVNEYTYDSFGNLLSVTDAAGNVTSMSYDKRGNKTGMADPDMGTWVYRHNALGKLVYQKDARLQESSLEYDVLGRMVKRTEAEGISTWVYDTAANGIGKPASESAPDSISRSYAYDSMGRSSITTTTVGASAFAMTTEYDGFSRVLKTIYPTSLAIRNVYNTYGYLEQIEDAADATMVYWKGSAPDAAGRITEHSLGNNLTTLHTYDQLTGHLVGINTGTTGLTDVQNLSYNFDSIGNLTQRQDLNQSLSEVFTYDDLNRLTGVELNGLITKSYQYDSIGNITNKSDVGIFEYDPNGVRPHAVVTAGGVAYSYDANGNQITGDGRSLIYTSFNKPLTAAKGTVNSSFYYDAGRNRIKKVSIKDSLTTTIIYLGKAFEEVSKPDGVTENKHYIGAGSATVIITTRTVGAADTRYLHKDHLGSTDVITDETGAVVERLSFAAFGARRNVSGWTDATAAIASLTTRGFTGHEMDDDIGLINMNARMYDAKLGRFLQPDSYVQYPETTQSYNRYTYVNNNPLSYTDPSGHFLKSLNKLMGKVTKPVRKGLKKYKLQIAALAIAYWQPWAIQGFWGAFLNGATASLVGSGGDANAALMGGITAGVFHGIGVGTETLHESIQIAAHALAGGVVSKAQGGEFSDGFWAQGFSKFVTVGMRKFPSLGNTEKFTVAVIAGGTVSKLGGGKFANGAVTAAFGYAFNEMKTQQRAREVAKEISESGGFKGKGEADWLYQINSDPNLHVEVDASRLTFMSDGGWKDCPRGATGVCSTGYVMGDDYAVHGQGTVRMRPNGTYGMYNQQYDYELHLDFSPRGISRNFGALFGSPGGGWPNTSYWINYRGNINVVYPE